MKKFIVLLLLLPAMVWGETSLKTDYYELSGTVTDSTGEPLAGAEILLPSLNTGTTTNRAGEYYLQQVPAGQYQLICRFMGYSPEKIELLLAQNTILDIRMEQTILTMPTINVTASAAPTDVLTSNRTVSVLSQEEITLQYSNSMSGALSTVPGVQIADQGPLIAKPVVRGMTNQRIVLLKNGIKHEAQQWSNHHTPETDIFEAERIEVLRGPASLLYGSGAIGGVIHIITPEPKTKQKGAPNFGMNVTTQMFTNTAQSAGAIALYGAKQYWGWRVNFSGRNSEYYAVPGHHHFLVKQLDTGYKQWNAHGSIGFQRQDLSLNLKASHYWEEQSLIGEGHWHNSGGPDGGPWYHAAGAIKSPTLHQKVLLAGKVRFGVHRLEFDAGVQHDHRQGIPSGMDPQVDLEADYLESNIKFHHIFNSYFPGTVGLSLSRKQDETFGAEVLIPNSVVQDVGLYLLQSLQGMNSLNFSAGLRLDWRRLDFKETIMQKAYLNDNRQIVPAYIVPEGKKTYDGVASGSLGIVWHQPDHPFSVATNLGTGWRAPLPVELYIRGVHHASYEYMIGDPDIQPEQSVNTDLIFRWVTKDVAYEFNAFYNRIYDYIFANPTGEFHYLGYRENIPIYRYEQSDARLYGFEWHNQFRLTNRVRVDFGYDLVRGEILSPMIDADGDGRVEKNLPHITPDRFRGGITLHLPDILLKNLKLRLETEYYMLQDKLGEFENVLNRDADGDGRNDELISKGYGLIHSSLRGEKNLFGIKTTVAAAVRNLTNETYFSHLSNYKGIAYNPGFDFSLKLIFQL
jgi:iron complex outermembrane receptor protein